MSDKLSLTLRPAMIHENLIIAEEYNKFKDWTQFTNNKTKKTPIKQSSSIGKFSIRSIA